MLVALGLMNVTGISVIAVLVLAQKLLAARAAIDVPRALAITGLAFPIIIAPWPVPGLTRRADKGGAWDSAFSAPSLYPSSLLASNVSS